MLGDEERYSDERYSGGYYNSGDWGRGNRGWDNAQPEYYDDYGMPQQAGPSQADEALAASIGKVLLVIIGILCIPIIVVVGVFYALFRWIRLRPGFIALIGAISTLFGFIMFMHGNVLARFLGTIPAQVTDFQVWKTSWPIIIKSYLNMGISVGMMIGPWIALVFIYMQCRKMRNSPWLVVNEGLSPKWMYGFTFRQTPFEILKTHLEVSKIKNDTLRPYGRKNLMPLGIEEDPLDKSEDPLKNRKNQLICRAEDEVPKHTLVTGAAGAGKTDTLKSMMLRDLDRGTTIVGIDCKKDPENAEFLSRVAREKGLNFYHFSADLPYRIQGNPEGPSSYDPLAHGSTAKKVDMMINTRTWDDAAAVYREQAESFLSKVFAVMDEAERLDILEKIPQLDTKHGELWTFTQMLDRNIFNAVIVAMNKIPEASYVRQQATELNAQLSPAAGRTPEGKATQHAQQEYLSKLTGLMVQSYGRWLKGGDGQGSGKIIDIGKLTSEPGNVILFSLDASNPQDQGSLIGSMICADLSNMTETRKNSGQNNPVSVYIDEFQSLPPKCVDSMIQKARSAGVGITLAFQSLDQVSAQTGDDRYVKALLDTCSNFVFHAGSNYDTGMMAAKIIGSHYKDRYMINRRNETRLGAFNWLNNRDLQVATSEQEEWIVDPSEFAKLSMPNRQNGWKSEAIVIKKASSDPVDKGRVGASAHKVHMIVPDEVLTEYFDPKSDPIDISIPMKIRASKGIMRDAKLASEAVSDDVAPLEDDEQDSDSYSTPSHDYAEDVPITTGPSSSARRPHKQRPAEQPRMRRRERPREADVEITTMEDELPMPDFSSLGIDDDKSEDNAPSLPKRKRRKPNAGRSRVSFEDF